MPSLFTLPADPLQTASVSTTPVTTDRQSISHSYAPKLAALSIVLRCPHMTDAHTRPFPRITRNYFDRPRHRQIYAHLQCFARLEHIKSHHTLFTPERHLPSIPQLSTAIDFELTSAPPTSSSRSPCGCRLR